MLSSLFSFLGDLWLVVAQALQLSSTMFQTLRNLPISNVVALTIVVLAGCSMLFGQSMILFLNRVPPIRFVYSLLFYGVIFALQQTLWALSIWGIAVSGFGANQPFSTALLVVVLGSAPLLFGFLVALPFLGIAIDWLLRSWSMLITIVALQSAFHSSALAAFASAIIGWLVLVFATRVFSRQLGQLRDILWLTVTSTKFDTNEEELLMATNTLRKLIVQRDNEVIAK